MSYMTPKQVLELAYAGSPIESIPDGWTVMQGQDSGGLDHGGGLIPPAAIQASSPNPFHWVSNDGGDEFWYVWWAGDRMPVHQVVRLPQDVTAGWERLEPALWNAILPRWRALA